MSDPLIALRGGFLSEKRRLGAPAPSARKVNTRQYRYPFATLNTSVVDLSNYVLIDQPGWWFGLNPATDANGVAIVHVDAPGNPVFLTPGSTKFIPQGFTRLYLERPVQPAVPARTDLYYVFDVSDQENPLSYGPLTAAALSSGADNFTANGKQSVLAVVGVDANATLITAAEPGRRQITISNESPGVETVWITLQQASPGPAWADTDAGIVAELSPGESITLPYTGAVYAFASANTALVLAYSLK